MSPGEVQTTEKAYSPTPILTRSRTSKTCLPPLRTCRNDDQPPSLNYDILSSILPLVDANDAAQLALASRSAYRLALPRFLADVTIGGLYHKPGNSAVTQLTAFCNFLLGPAPAWHGAPTARLDDLRTLESAVSLLSAVLARAHSLQRLTLWGSDALFTADPDFAQGSSPSIETLVLGGDIAPLPVLAKAFPNVRELIFLGVNGSCAPNWAFFQPDANSDALGPWQNTLERVDTGFAVMPLQCPVKRVVVREPVMDGFDHLYPAREFLGHAQPVVLSLLFLELTGDRCEGLKESAEWRGSVSSALALVPFLNLRGLSLSVTPAVLLRLWWKAEGERPPAPPEAIRTVDFHAIAQAVAESAPSLQFITIDLTRQREPWIGACFVLAGAATVARMRAFNQYD
ncbi:uncharacterized protein BXZ73DRAFT_104915 [Epithele typhae]|uniref:uncharacterized protein n=1 Tax=Epithele typhae TaxID=378194 RepID=UPI0020086A8E|nr:uncharacterized protein BXZ73DRAFT_104915 [Epithele typhae]KAH9919441.1 hypothetical protein BXZ73DRAFT_104915 [Epithele typhae]